MFGGFKPSKTNVSLQVGEALLSGSIQAIPLPAPFCDRVQRRVLQKLRGAPFDPGMRTFREPRVDLFDEPGLAETRFANDLDDWPSPARARSQRRASRLSSSSRPTNGVRARAPPLRRPPLARTTRKS